ncbi:MAG TPA: pyridoxal-phosphate dependent enzyme [Stellaceae bacterium]|nr:pyridoxal-phosphate dependent enzyme [Stellaceae bacterium]
MIPPSFSDIRAAQAAIKGSVLRTPSLAAPTLAARFGASVILKLETLHPTGSFKERGALNKLLSLRAPRGVIAMSAGNHAQGLAYHAKTLGIPATIVMPEGTPFNKVERTESHGAKVLLRGASLAEAERAAMALAASEGLTFVHPYDDPEIIAGQGTIALELLEDHPELDAILVPVGGGGLVAGIAIAARALKPGIEIVGVRVPLSGPTLADGIAVKEPGALPRAVIAAERVRCVTVDETMIEAAIETFLETERLVVEGAGAAPLAALDHDPRSFAGKQVALLVSGGNIDARILSSILMRGLARSGQLARFRIELSDVPGALARVTQIIGAAGGNIVEIYHQRLFHDVPVKLAEVDAVVETRNPRHIQEIDSALTAAGFPTRRLSNRSLET